MMEKLLGKIDGRDDGNHGFKGATANLASVIGPEMAAATKRTGEQFRHLAYQVKSQLASTGKGAKDAVIRHVHRRPWGYIAAAGVVGMLMAYVTVGRKAAVAVKTAKL